jgi:hypothetical protein
VITPLPDNDAEAVSFALNGADDKVVQQAIGFDAGGQSLDGLAVEFPARVRG